MTMRTAAGAAAIALLLAGSAWAQSSTTTSASFENLSAGNQKIAGALFSAQRVRGTSASVMSRDQIAALRSSAGWGRVFKQMKADGLISARNLGQVVSRHEHQLHASAAATRGSSSTRGASAGTTRTASARFGGRGGWHAARFASSPWHGGASYAGGRGFAAAPGAIGGFGSSAMGGFGHGGMGGGFGGGGHGR